MIVTEVFLPQNVVLCLFVTNISTHGSLLRLNALGRAWALDANGLIVWLNVRSMAGAAGISQS
jgi:hypothetical protein